MEPRLVALNLTSLLNSNLRVRAASSAILIPLALLAVYLGDWPYAAVVALITGVGLWEWLRLIDTRLPQPVANFAYGALGFILYIGMGLSAFWGSMALVGLTAALFLVAYVMHVKKPGLIAVGLPYMAGSGLALIYLRSLPEGMAWLCFLLLAVWGTDIGAYAAGRLIGGPKLAPSISPKKTWAGLLGGMALAAVFGYGVAYGLTLAQPPALCLLAIVIAVVAQVGDLFKSFFKRRAGVKDSGSLIPGHGGVLDRIDGLVFAAVFLAMVELVKV